MWFAGRVPGGGSSGSRGSPTTVVGLHAASGSAVAVGLTGPPEAPSLVARDGFPLIPGDRDFAMVQPYHAAEGKPPVEAEAIVHRALDSARRRAVAGLAGVLEALDLSGDRPAALAIADRPETALEPVDVILRSHVRMHAAEGEMLRDALRRAVGSVDTPAVALMERDLPRLVATRLGVTEDDVAARASALGKSLGPPWQKAHKTAALAAWAVLLGAADTA
jgi:hypothetical protein